MAEDQTEVESKLEELTLKEESDVGSVGNEEATDLLIKHPLQNRWTLWYDNPGKKITSQQWQDSLKKIVTFDTVEDFWGIFNNIRPASKLTLGSNYHLFKEGVEPKWEHPDNFKGGKWIVTIKGRGSMLDQQWLWLLLGVIGESFEEENEICGCVVSLRKSQDRITLWTRNAYNEAVQRRIGYRLKRLLEIPDNITVGYQIHSDSMKRHSSFNNRNRYEV
ncbi:hypothetical protein PROFUN_00397 [Planoprotostelium fungivorum]|uniref:mRNA cap-binding protein n=1 Tax=Planoprotostelium fungivorum TaxID=1890364 RepID=A0A2P6NYB0_9EUKA|nr:hypothetical protein PROFUN_00397 [Planoprotostelium fungivorum]